MQHELFFHAGYLFCHDPATGTGTIYDPQYDGPTMPVECNYGGPGDSFASQQEALDYFAAMGRSGS